MPDVKVKVKSENWESASKWAEANAGRLKLSIEKRIIDVISLYKKTTRREIYLHYKPQLFGQEIVGLLAIYFGLNLPTGTGKRYLSASWKEGEPPSSLEELIESGEVPGPEIGNRLQIKKAANTFPAFAEAYEEIHKRLFPRVGHHEIHRDISSWEEMLSRDTALIRRLGRGRCLRSR